MLTAKFALFTRQETRVLKYITMLAYTLRRNVFAFLRRAVAAQEDETECRLLVLYSSS